MADAKTVFSLTMRDLATGQLKQFEGQYAKTLKGIAGADEGGFAQLATNLGSVEGTLTLLGMSAPQVTAAMMALNAAGVAMDWARQAAEVETVRTSYTRLAEGVGVSAQSMLQALRETSAGTIADRDLMLAANSAMALGVADTAEEMTSLLEVAIAKGAEFGIAPTKAFGDLINGLGRMSPEILNNIGVVVDAEAAYAAYAAQVGTTAKQLSDGQKMQALVNATLAANPGAAAAAAVAGDSAAAAFARWEVSTRQFSETMGTVFLPAATAGLDVATRFVDALAKAGDAPESAAEWQLAGVDDQIAKWQDAQVHSDPEDAFTAGQVAGFQQLRTALELTATALEQGLPAADEWQAALGALAAAAVESGSLTTEQAAAVAELAAQLRAATQAIGFTGSAYDTIAPKVDAVTLKLLEQAQAARQAVAETMKATGSQISGALLGMAGDLGAGQALALDKELNAELAERTRLMESWHYDEDKIRYENAAWQQRELEKLNEGIRAQQTLGEAGASAGSKMADGYADATAGLDDLQSKVQGVLQGGLSLDVDWPGKDEGGGDNRDLNENARRMAAIANEGLIGQPWLDDLAAEAPGAYADLMLKIASGMDAQSAAQSIMQDFQDGLRPDMLDQEAAKDRVRRLILGEASMAAMAQEIAAELSQEMGVSMPEALAAANQALGVKGGGGGDGSQLGAGFVEGVDGDAAATGSLAKIAKAFLENETSVRTSGGVVGAWWGEGFMAVVGANVPPGLLDMLTAKLLPGILAAVAAGKSTTGPNDG